MERSKKDPAWPLPRLGKLLASIHSISDPPHPQQEEKRASVKRAPRTDRGSRKPPLIPDEKEASGKLKVIQYFLLLFIF